MIYRINVDLWSGVFAVPNAVTDDYIKLAGSNALKVLLYLLRHGGEDISDQILSQCIGISEEYVRESIIFWEQLNVINPNMTDSKTNIQSDNQIVFVKSECVNENLVADSKTNTSVTEIKSEDQTQSKPIKNSAKRIFTESTSGLTSSEIAVRINSDPLVKHLFEHTESLYKKPLTHTERKSLIIIIDYIKLPVDITMMLIEYCTSINKTSPKYIEKIAADWFEKDIVTVDKAEELIKQMKSRNSFEKWVKSEFEINRALSANEKECIEKWQEIGVSKDLIIHAYEITADKKGKLSMSYMTGIIQNWIKENITTKEQLGVQLKIQKERDYSESSIDLDEYEQKALEKYMK